MLTVVAMGCCSGDITLRAIDCLKQSDNVVLRSRDTHMSSTLDSLGIAYTSCDDLYEQAEDFDNLNELVLARLNKLSSDSNVAFCVVGQGSDDSIVQLLGNGTNLIGNVGVENKLMQYASNTCVTAITAYELLDYRTIDASNLVVKYIDNVLIASDIKIMLLDMFDSDSDMYVTDGENVTKCTLEQLDQLEYSYMTSVLVVAKPLISKQVHNYSDIVNIVDILRAPNGCPWDRAQTHESIKRNCIEEAYELAHAIDSGDYDNIIEELGDVLLQVVLHNAMATDEGEFSANDTISTLCNKLITRHPHVFGEVVVKDDKQAMDSWDKVKAKQHSIKSLTENLIDVPASMSMLMRANKVQSRASKGGYDFASVSQAVECLRSEIDELLSATTSEDKYLEGGDLLFSAVNVLRLYGVDSETALLTSTDKFIDRVSKCEQLLSEQGSSMDKLSAEQFDELWAKVKKL